MTTVKNRAEQMKRSSSISEGYQEETEEQQIETEAEACCCMSRMIIGAFGCIKGVITTIAYMALFKSLFSLGIFFYDFSSTYLHEKIIIYIT